MKNTQMTYLEKCHVLIFSLNVEKKNMQLNNSFWNATVPKQAQTYFQWFYFLLKRPEKFGSESNQCILGEFFLIEKDSKNVFHVCKAYLNSIHLKKNIFHIRMSLQYIYFWDIKIQVFIKESKEKPNHSKIEMIVRKSTRWNMLFCSRASNIYT